MVYTVNVRVYLTFKGYPKVVQNSLSVIIESKLHAFTTDVNQQNSMKL